MSPPKHPQVTGSPSGHAGVIFPSGATRVALALLVVFGLSAGCHPGNQVATPRHPVVNEYHGQRITNDYQWLEAATNSAVREWTKAQNVRARALLDHVESRPLVEARLRELFANTSPNYSSFAWAGGKLIFLEFKPPAQQPVLKLLSGTNDLERAEVVLDPNKLSSDGSTSIDWFVPSRDGKRVAISLSARGSESGALHFYETATGRKLPGEIPRVNGATAGGSAAWNGDGTGVFYTRYPRKGERDDADLDFHQQIYFHELGTPPERDRYEAGKEFPRIAEVALHPSPDHRWLLATVANGDGGEHAHWLRGAGGEWRQITRFTDGVKSAQFGRDPLFIEWGRDDALYLLSRDHAPKGKILRLPLAQPQLANATVAVAEGKNSIVSFAPAASSLYVAYVNGGPMELRSFGFFEQTNRVLAPRLFGGRPGTNAPPEEERITPTAIQDLLVTRGDELLFRSTTFTEPARWQRYDPNKDRSRVETTAFSGESAANFDDVEVLRETATSKDGTRVPLNILRRKGTRLNGDSPTILTGYGGYGRSLVANFEVTRRLWLDQGGVIAIANLRGGGEFGEAWHLAGNLTHKQNVFDDFTACAEFLIRSNYTKSSRLAIEGRSNGGLLMGAMLAQQPQLFQAVVSHVGVYDALRAELDPNGVFNVTEFGTVNDPAQFDALRAYSPYHRIKDGIDYPATLLLTGEHDGRVNPAHSRKMAARLQAATSGRRPVLLRTSGHTGHGSGTPLDARIDQMADVYAFLCEQLGVVYSVVDRGPWAGAVTPGSAVVKGKLVHAGMKTRLVLSEDETFSRSSAVGPVLSETNHGNVVAFELRGLKPDTRYHYALEVNGRLDRAKRGEFRTFPPGPASFRIAFASCARTGSTSDVFDRIRENQPLFYMNMGDFHYLNIATNLRSRFRAGYDAVLASPQQSELYRHVPFVYMWDDHDFGGNNVGRRSRSHESARVTYQEYVPHYPLAAGSGDVPIYQSFHAGRVKFILTDLRSERDSLTNKDDASKTMMGPEQKEWFKQELLSAKGKYPLICWVSSVPWLGEKGTNHYRGLGTNRFGFIHHTNLLAEAAARTNSSRTNLTGASTNLTSTSTNRPGRGPGGRGGGGQTDDDHWDMFATERREIADFIKSNHITGVCILHGDAHMLGADDGRNGDFATGGGAPIPVMCGAPLDQDASIKGGPYSQGVYRMRKGEGGFGLLTITDRGDAIDVAYSGRNNKNEEKIALHFTVPAGGKLALASPKRP